MLYAKTTLGKLRQSRIYAKKLIKYLKCIKEYYEFENISQIFVKIAYYI
jgi:hypothetical protein